MAHCPAISLLAVDNQMMPCPRCGFTHNCICALEPTLSCPAYFVLLTHPNEYGKQSNTGQLMLRSLPHCQHVEWQRTQPPRDLLALINAADISPWLLFPGDVHAPAQPYQPSAATTPLFIILDATWQEAKKMVRKSPWLSDLPRLQLNPSSGSRYQLRRNQQPGNLCTCEAGIAVLHQLNHHTDAAALEHYFNAFIDTYQADKSGHPARNHPDTGG